MEEELNENELEGRLYAMLHHVDETQNNVITSNQHEENIRLLESAPRSTLRRYWRTSTEHNTPNQKVNTPKEPIPAENYKISTAVNNAKPKAEKCVIPKASPTIDLSLLQSAVPQNIKKSIEILDHEQDNHVVLESSDEDEVIEVALPPKPTITIESSDEDELHVIKIDTPTKSSTKQSTFNKPHGIDREVSASPVPSVVSSVSDDFIRGDCIALNISSRHPDNHSFDFSLHGSDLIDHSTPSKKKKKKKSKETTLAPVMSTPEKSVVNKNITDECFATPKSKTKNKKQKNKSFVVNEKSVPNADVYDSDSNQSMIDTNKGNSYVVTEKSLPSADVYESDSSHSEPLKDNTKTKPNNDIELSDTSISLDKPQETSKSSKKIESSSQANRTHGTISIVDLTENDKYITLDSTGICESIVMANVTGFMESEDYGDENLSQNSPSKFGSTKVPAILNEDLDFDNLKGKNNVCKRRRYSLTTLRAEMEKFYNESWGGEDFNHREIQKNMSRDKSLWMIDPKDRMSSMSRRRVPTCNYCNRVGHRDDTCRLKPPVCYMCGCSGHFEPRCPRKICVNCGSPNQMYSSMCRNCCGWGSVACHECGQRGHPATHCPDIWRRYHNTIDLNTQLEKCNQTKKHHQLFCSGCTRRGHLVHTCRITLPFSGLPINSPYVYFYRPCYSPTNNTEICNKFNKSQQYKNTQESPSPAEIQFRNDRNKRQSKSPTAHENHVNKKRNVSATEDNDARRNTKSPINNNPQRKTSMSKEDDTNKPKSQAKTSSAIDKVTGVENAPNFIPLCSTNHDNKGHMIQDNEVSDTSDVVTSARIYVTNEIIDLLKSKDGEEWLKVTTNKHSVIVENTEINSFLSIKGKLESQECFQNELRDWIRSKVNKENIKSNNETDTSNENNQDLSLSNIPKHRNNLLRHLNKAFESLKRDFGDPKAIYKELTYLQNRHQQLLSQKVVNPKQLTNSKGHINDMLKKLNMVLIGQAGLADGTGHLNELYSFQEKLMNSRSKVIPNELRKEIGQHYQIIFTALPRDDYRELLKTYHYSNKPSAMSKKKKRDNPYKLSQKMNKLMKMNSIPAQTMHKSVGANINGSDNVGLATGGECRIFRKLFLYHKRLLHLRTPNKLLKKRRMELVTKLRRFMNIYKNENMSSKAIKKLKRAQEEAHVFLANV